MGPSQDTWRSLGKPEAPCSCPVSRSPEPDHSTWSFSLSLVPLPPQLAAKPKLVSDHEMVLGPRCRAGRGHPDPESGGSPLSCKPPTRVSSIWHWSSAHLGLGWSGQDCL